MINNLCPDRFGDVEYFIQYPAVCDVITSTRHNQPHTNETRMLKDEKKIERTKKKLSKRR